MIKQHTTTRARRSKRAVAGIVATGIATVAGAVLVPTAANAASDSTWDALAQCESGGNWSINTGNGYYGGLQFSLTTWHSYGGTGYPHQASKATQIAIGKKVQAAKGWNAWPGCARSLGFV